MSRTLTHRSHFPSPFAALVVFICLFVCSGQLQASNELFQIYCPPDTTVDCDAEIWDLSGFGNAYYHDYTGTHSAGDPISEEYNLNSCGTGTIVRTWVAYDYHNDPHYCSQTIYVGGAGNIYIHWPPDYVLEDCTPHTDPEDLPPPYDKPVVDDSYAPCTQIMIGYEDQVFDISDGCIKILRHWTVIDWCQYDPNDSYPAGKWTHTQIIKVVPTGPPTIMCPMDLTVSADGSCEGAYVHIPPATAMSECGGDVTIKNTSPYADNNGADASGFYPLGTTHVTFKVSNECGGYSYTSCTMKVTVVDLKAPTPICYYGISVSLMPMGDGAMLELQPHFFDKGSFDNCTPSNKLKFDIEPKQVTCADLGQIAVKVFVTDESGNSAHCNTVAVVQDNQGACPATNGLIQGGVFTADGAELTDVKVMLEGTAKFDMTEEDGSYNFENVQFGNDYTVTPVRKSADGSGISTMDLVVLLKHVLGIDTITDPYLQLAGDINGSGHLSVNDLIDLKDMILRGHYNVPVETEWRYVDAGHLFPSNTSPFDSVIPEWYQIQQYDADMIDLNFIGVKVGDLTGEANLPLISGTRQGGIPFQLTADASTAFANAGDVFEVRISGADRQFSMNAIQLALGFDPAEVELIETGEFTLPGMDGSFVNLNGASDGLVNAIWFDRSPVAGDETVMILRFRALKGVDTRNVVQIAGKLNQSVAYDAEGTEYEVELVPTAFEELPDSEEPMVLGDAFPNPFASDVTIPLIYHGEMDEINIEAYDGVGRCIYRQDATVVDGTNLIQLQGIEYSGMFIVKISDGQQSNTTRIVSLKRD